MYGDLLLDRLGVKFLGPAPLHLELLHMLTTFHWNALGSTLGWWFCLFGRRLCRCKQVLGNPFPFGNVPCKIQLVPKTVSRNEKFWVDQVTVPQPPPGGTTRGGERQGGGGT